MAESRLYEDDSRAQDVSESSKDHPNARAILFWAFLEFPDAVIGTVGYIRVSLQLLDDRVIFRALH